MSDNDSELAPSDSMSQLGLCKGKKSGPRTPARTVPSSPMPKAKGSPVKKTSANGNAIANGRSSKERKRKAADLDEEAGDEMDGNGGGENGGDDVSDEDEKKQVFKKARASNGQAGVKSLGGGKNSGAEWTAAEKRIIFNACHPQVTPSWKEVAAMCPGRSLPSLRMYYTRVIRKKVDEMLAD